MRTHILPSSLSWFPAQPLLPICTAITSFPSPELPHSPASDSLIFTHTLSLSLALSLSLFLSLSLAGVCVCVRVCVYVYIYIYIYIYSGLLPFVLCQFVCVAMCFSSFLCSRPICPPLCPAFGPTLHPYLATVQTDQTWTQRTLSFPTCLSSGMTSE